MSEDRQPSVEELCGLIREQQDRIEQLERLILPQIGGDDHARAATPAATEDVARQRHGMSRGALLRTAAAGAAGAAATALLADPSAALAATGAFTSAGSAPTVTVYNTGSGQGLSVHAQTSGHAVGVLNTGSGPSVEADSSSTAAGANAVHGLITTTSPGGFSAGVQGDNKGTGGLGIGVSGSQNGSGYGVYGTTPSGYGVYGESTSGTGVVGGSSSGVGVSGSSNGSYGVSATTYSTANNAAAVYATMSSSTPGTGTSAVYGYNYDTGTTGIGVYGEQLGGGYGVWGEADNSAGYGVYGVSTSGYGVVARGGTYSVYGIGNFAITGGTKAAIVPFADGTHRTFYCVESPECWFEDFGSASLHDGNAVVSLDPKFAEAVETGEYYVFLSAEGNSKGLFVTEKTATGFNVREQEGGKSNIPFSYRIVALRADVDAPRLAIAPNVPAHKPSIPPRATAPEPLRTQQSRADAAARRSVRLNAR